MYERTAYSSSEEEAGSRGRWYCATRRYYLSEGMARVARPCQHEAAAKAGKVMQRRVGRVQMQNR